MTPDPLLIDYPRKRKSNNPNGRYPVVHTHCSQCEKPLVTDEDKDCAHKYGGRCLECRQKRQREYYHTRKVRVARIDTELHRIEVVADEPKVREFGWGPPWGFSNAGGDTLDCSTDAFTKRKIAERLGREGE